LLRTRLAKATAIASLAAGAALLLPATAAVAAPSAVPATASQAAGQTAVPSLPSPNDLTWG
jgi:hypothetical protein